MSRYDWVGKPIHRKLRKRLKFDHADKWYIYKPESVQENEYEQFSGTLRYI